MVNQDLASFITEIGNTGLFSQAFDHFPSGVMVINKETVLIYYNEAQGLIDDIKPQHAIGKTILDLYRVNGNNHYPTLHCLFTRKPLINIPCFYYTHLGKLINSLHSVFPFFSNDKLAGCICFVRDYREIVSQYTNFTDSTKQPELTPAIRTLHTFTEIITHDPAMRQCLDIISQSANSPSPIMLYGETGCGKEMFAQAIHNISRRHHEQYMTLNCAAIPENLLEGMLFGTVKGAFTGSLDKAGMMELADGGTIFLDEINSMPLGLQSKMLRAVQDQKIRRVGGSKDKVVSLKIISASNANPHQAVATGQLRADLFFRLGVVMVGIPPLRDRPADIPLLSKYFIKKHNQRLNKKITMLPPQLEQAFAQYHWPGNVRELEHALEGAMNIAGENEIILDPSHFRSSLLGGILTKFNIEQQPQHMDLSETTGKELLHSSNDNNEIKHLVKALEEAGGNAAKAARKLQISPQLMSYKMKKYGLKKKMKISHYYPPKG